MKRYSVDDADIFKKNSATTYRNIGGDLSGIKSEQTSP